MSRIENSVYGLALGDAMGYFTEFMYWADGIKKYYDYPDNYLDKEEWQISDDTQMSIAVAETVHNVLHDMPQATNDDFMQPMAKSFVRWLNGEPLRGPGNSCVSAISALERDNCINLYKYAGSEAKGSGTVMRSPWIGLMHSISDENLEDFCTKQASLTHGHATAIHCSYLTALITRKLYKGELVPGELIAFIRDYASSQAMDDGWFELIITLDNIQYLPQDWASKGFNEYDPSYAIGFSGTAVNVLVTAALITDAFGQNRPIDGLKRGMFCGGDSDSLNALNGAFIGASHDTPNLWGYDLSDKIEKAYKPRLENIVTSLEQQKLIYV